MQVDPIIEALIARRKASGLSREQMANIAGMSVKTYQRIERGESDLKLSQYRSILRSLHLTDLDIALDIRGVQHVTADDLMAVARLLSPEAQSLLVRLLSLVIEQRNTKSGS
ncbi:MULTISPECIES: helix-turn-helix domain-containing protein [Vibrio]|uniref:helix-turn-helix domain-containing protein n=2 Tax=Vibrionaceae TaxID=641 RepID=UPI0006301C55|nr:MULTISPECIES: helix-turn-helix transcriptional regulator [Vibrio]MCR9497223.1 helix-turn-helix domain-containing protein [Vibrio alginolyticus]MCK8062778.1 helix-turn-helix domain-containing protein [Vibrio sp. 1CM7H]MCQ9062950.1 helix-turn-helix transcriptional regulator [Vibrio diabolicus]MCR9549476.1 helix-turn-helix domain-containing protein [Vibrio antiquarius]MCR9939294.1 helix-turn-helix domain-containing protein [Vibrio antiquarius]